MLESVNFPNYVIKTFLHIKITDYFLEEYHFHKSRYFHHLKCNAFMSLIHATLRNSTEAICRKTFVALFKKKTTI